MSSSTSASNDTYTSGRCLMSLLIGSGLVWLLAAAALGLVSTAQLVSPSFLQGTSVLTHGRVSALQETAFIYGFAVNAGLAVAIGILGRLGGAPLRGLGLASVGTLFWNGTVTAGLIAIAAGEMTSIPYLQMPRYLHPLLLVAYAAIATPGVLAWTGRRQSATYAAQWYAVAALFLFPWVYSAAQVMLLHVPMRGVAHAVAATWLSQNFLTCFLVPVALAAAYYLVPKLTGRTVNHYEYAPHGFWTLIFFGTWTGARTLVAGPVPAWIPVLAIVATFIVLFHYVVVVLNLHFGMHGAKETAGKFLAVGLVAYAISGVADSVFSFQGIAERLQYTYFTVAQSRLLLQGGVSLPLFAAIYYLVPRMTGLQWPSAVLTRAHYGLSVAALAFSTIGFAIAGWSQGNALMDPTQDFTSIASHTKPGLLGAVIGDALLLTASAVVLVHFFSVCKAAYCPLRGASAAALKASTV